MHERQCGVPPGIVRAGECHGSFDRRRCAANSGGWHTVPFQCTRVGGAQRRVVVEKAAGHGHVDLTRVTECPDRGAGESLGRSQDEVACDTVSVALIEHDASECRNIGDRPRTTVNGLGKIVGFAVECLECTSPQGRRRPAAVPRANSRAKAATPELEGSAVVIDEIARPIDDARGPVRTQR